MSVGISKPVGFSLPERTHHPGHNLYKTFVEGRLTLKEASSKLGMSEFHAGRLFLGETRLWPATAHRIESLGWGKAKEILIDQQIYYLYKMLNESPITKG